jgi:resuscitation-promoting factor RpfA
VRIDIEAKALTVMSGAVGIVAALTLSAPAAFADPALPGAPGPDAGVQAPVAGVQAAEAGVQAPVQAPVAGVQAPVATVQAAEAGVQAPVATVQAAGTDPVTPPDGMPHLSSPQNLPPDTTTTPPDDNQQRGLGYLRDLWHAVQTQDVSGRDALLLLTQRPLDPNAAAPGLPPGPTPPQPGVPGPPP